jgi:outer membrane biosynthesis protein TonB
MAKFAIISLNLLAIVIYNLFFGGDVNVDQKLPENVMAGESFIMEVVIEKGDRQGFAKWQQTLPEGFIAEAKETNGATFSFKNQDVKLIWMALPEEESFTVTYEVFTEPMIRGNFDINGKFSFIEENERKDITAEVKQIEVKQAGDVVIDDIAETETTVEAENEEEETEAEVDKESDEPQEIELTEEPEEEEENTVDTSEEVAETETDSKEETETTDKANYITKTDDVKISRQIEHLQDGQYTVTLNIQKGNFNSFGKIEEYLPPGFIASEESSQEGKFSFDDKVMKILWMALPEVDQITVSYGIESTTDELDSATIHGVFSYLDEEESKQVAMKGSKFKNFYTAPLAEVKEEIEEAEVGNEPTEITEEQAEAIADVVEESAEEKATEVGSEIAEAVEEPVQEETTQELEDEVTNIPAPETDVRYKVQIAAAKKEVDQQYFTSRHGISENVNMEYHNAWYKYTLGSYEVYRQARDKRNQIWADDNKINDAFVTAYNAGERISVQEALMITNQKWFK